MVLPRALVFGEALTDLVQGTPGQWKGYPGGAPWNVARALSRLGVGCAFAGSVSMDSLGDEIVLQSEAAALDMRFIQRVDRTPLVAIVPSSSPPKYFFAGDADLFFDPDLMPEGWINQAELCHFSCISLARQPLADRLVKIAQQAKEAGKRISYDPNWRNLMDGHYREHTFPTMTTLADMIKLSDEDLRHIYPGLSEQQAMHELRAMDHIDIAAGADPVGEAMALFRRIGPAASALRTLPEPQRSDVKERLLALVEAHLEGGRVTFPAAAWVVSASSDHRNG